MSAGLGAALARAEDLLRAHGLTGGQAFDALVDGLRERLGDGVVASDPAREAVKDIPLDGGSDDVLGLAYERFFADLFKGKRGQYFTPPPIARLLMAFAGVGPGDDVLDPTCGSGGLLIEAARMGARVRGLELDPRLASLAGLHLRLSGYTAAVQRADFFSATGELADVVVANPPFSVEIRDREVLDRFELGRGRARVLSDHLFIEAVSRWVRPGGRAALVLPLSVLTNPSTAELRRRIDADWVRDRVCSLPEGVFRPFGGAAGRACLVWLTRRGVGVADSTPCGYAALDDPGYDVRLQRVQETSGDSLRALLAGEGWQRLPAGRWVPRGANVVGVPLSRLAAMRHERVAMDVPSPPGAVVDLADADRHTGEVRVRVVPPGTLSGTRLALEHGDVLVARLRPALGNVAVVDTGDHDRVVGSTEWIPLTVPRLRHWVLHVLRAPAWRAQLPISGGQTRPRTNPQAVLASQVPMPAVELADRVHALSSALHTQRRAARDRLDALQEAVDGFVAGALDEQALEARVAAVERQVEETAG